MKKKLKLFSGLLYALTAIVTAGFVFVSNNQESTCLVLLDGVNAVAQSLSDGENPDWEYGHRDIPDPRFIIRNGYDNCKLGQHIAYCESIPKNSQDYPNARKHCLPQDCHKVGDECSHGYGDNHYSSNCACGSN